MIGSLIVTVEVTEVVKMPRGITKHEMKPVSQGEG